MTSIEPGMMVVDVGNDKDICPCSHLHDVDPFIETHENEGRQFLVLDVKPNPAPGYTGCFLLRLAGLPNYGWCFGTFRPLPSQNLEEDDEDELRHPSELEPT